MSAKVSSTVLQTSRGGDSPAEFSADLLILVRPQCWRIVSAESSALLPSGIINTIVTPPTGLASNGPFSVDPTGRRGFRDPQAISLGPAV
jgi:hypothetical protein